MNTPDKQTKLTDADNRAALPEGAGEGGGDGYRGKYMLTEGDLTMVTEGDWTWA